MDAQDYISRKIKILRDEGYPEKQAIAIAYNMAREMGYRVQSRPDPRTVTKRKRKSKTMAKSGSRFPHVRHKMKHPKPKSGYGFHTERKTWKSIKNDNWDIVMLSTQQIKEAEYVGHRKIDDVTCIVWKIPYGFIAQKMH